MARFILLIGNSYVETSFTKYYTRQFLKGENEVNCKFNHAYTINLQISSINSFLACKFFCH